MIKVAQLPLPHGAWLAEQAAWLRRWGADPVAGPAVVPLWDEGHWEDRLFLVLEPMEALLDRWAPGRSVDARLAAARALAAAVVRLHAAGALHGDLKPGNLALLRDGEAVLVLDPAGPSRQALTPGYAAPERMAGRPVSAATDAFAVAATTWWLLAGQLPSAPPRRVERQALRAALASTPGGEDVVRVLVVQVARRPWRRPTLARLALVLARAGRAPPAPARVPSRPACAGRRLRAAGTLLATGTLLTAGALLAASTRFAGGGPPSPGSASAPEARPCPAGFLPDGPACAAPDGRRIVYLPAGRYLQGSPASDPGDAPPHPVRLDRAFWLGEAEVTQAEWSAFGGGDPVGTRRQVLGQGLETDCATWEGFDLRGADKPVVCVDWNEVVDWLDDLSDHDGLRPAYRVEAGADGSPRVRWDREADGWRLPTEAEWEWAARGGPTGDLGPEPVCARANTRDQSAPEHWGSEAACDDARPVLAPVRSLAPNGSGLHDLQGNVLEWVWDLYGDYPATAVRDPAGPAVGRRRVLRGGSWNHIPRGPWARYAQPPEDHANVVGLRLCRNAD